MISRHFDTRCARDPWITLHVMRDRDAAERLRVWLSQRQNWVLGLDCETNALPPQHRDFRVRAVQIADADTAWVLDVESLGTELVAALIRGHRTWVAQFAGVAEVPFLHHGVPGALRLDEDEPHVVELQTLLAWFDPRTLVPAGKDGIDPRLSRPRGLKDNTTRWLTPVLAEVEAEMHAWFHEHAPKGHRTPKKAKAWGFANIPVDSELYQLYSGLDPLMAVRLWNMMIETIQRRGVVHSLMDDLRTQWDCDRAVLRGLPVDEAYVRWLDRKLRSVVDEAAEHLARLGIKPSGSGPQVGEAFARLGVQSPKQSPKTGKPSWDKEVLKALAKRGPGDPGGWLAQRIIEVRQATKFHAAYVQPMLDALELDGHVHCDLRALGTVTGRMSAARPAIQQLPKKDTRVRAAYGGRLGWVFVSCDLAQGEPRTMAALSGDPNLIADIEAGDINNAVTAAAFGHAFDPSEGKVAGTPSYIMRQGGKAGFLAKVYGAGIGRLATTIGTDDPATRAINDRWEQRYSVMFERFARLNQGVKITLANGFEVPLWDRYTVDDETGELLVYPKPSRKAGNYETQGTQKLYLNQAWRRMVARGWSWALAMFVHDEILLLVPEFMAEAARRDLEECMTFDIGNGVTMLCEATIDGPTWLPQPSNFDLRELEAVEI